MPNKGVESWMTRIRAHAAAAASGGPWPTSRAVRLAIRFGLAQPATRRPDLDNLAKAILDALGGGRAAGRWSPIVFLDDAQVVELHVTKHQVAAEAECVAVVVHVVA